MAAPSYKSAAPWPGETRRRAAVLVERRGFDAPPCRCGGSCAVRQRARLRSARQQYQTVASTQLKPGRTSRWRGQAGGDCCDDAAPARVGEKAVDQLAESELGRLALRGEL